MEETTDKLDFIKIKTFYSVKENKKTSQLGRKYLQKTCPIKVCYAKAA